MEQHDRSLWTRIISERSQSMFTDASILFQIAGIGIIVALIHTILKQMGKEEIAQFATLIGFIIVLVVVINGLSDLFQQIKSVFLFQG
nr:stage III sporulation protein AC [Oceanobacillus picturae]